MDLPVSAFTNSETGLGEAVTFADANGVENTISVIFQDPHAFAQVEGLEISSANPIAYAALTDVPKALPGGTIARASGAVYKILDVKPDGTGGAFLVLGN
jgi:hypothetical protein